MTPVKLYVRLIVKYIHHGLDTDIFFLKMMWFKISQNAGLSLKY